MISCLGGSDIIKLNTNNELYAVTDQIKLSLLYPASTGRNTDEVMRVVESLKRASEHRIATPADWKPGEPVVISPSVSDEEAKKMFPQGFETAELPSKKGYLRFTQVD